MQNRKERGGVSACAPPIVCGSAGDSYEAQDLSVSFHPEDFLDQRSRQRIFAIGEPSGNRHLRRPSRWISILGRACRHALRGQLSSRPKPELASEAVAGTPPPYLAGLRNHESTTFIAEFN